MKKRKIKDSGYYSYLIGDLPKGCQLCVKGRKSVFFITGLCSCRCFFCPISDEKKDKDVIYINEWPTDKEQDILEEIRLCSSDGVGITGGDPLLRLDRTLHFISLLKEKFGKGFHIHIYVPLSHVTRESLENLFKAGLDEIRFHPDIDDESEWDRISLAKEFNWDIGVEIPVIPGKEKETRKLIDFIHDKIDFLNLNELEFSDTNFNRILEKGFRAKDDISYAVKGSMEMGANLMDYILDRGYPISVHLCTAKLKDSVQLAERIKLRSEKSKKPFDLVDDEGLLIRGAIYDDETIPGIDYKKKISAISDNQKISIIKRLQALRAKIISDFEVPDNMIEIDNTRLRILTDPEFLKTIASGLEKKAAIVKEFPTHDMFEIELEFLN